MRWLIFGIKTTAELGRRQKSFLLGAGATPDLQLAGKDGYRCWIGRFHRGQRQADFDHQAAFGSVGYSDGAAVETYRAIRDGQAQSDAAGLAATGVVDAVERAEKFVDRVLGDARTGVDYAHYCFLFVRGITCGLRFLQRNFLETCVGGDLNVAFQYQLDLGAFVGVADRVAHNILDRAVQQTRAARSPRTHQ